jgi:uroporphyrinogen decarboxylase
MNDRFLRACRRQPTDCTPVWFMRQAGRYMPEYRALRQKHGFLHMVKTPELATEISLQPVNAFEVDAAIIFADILPPLEGLGLQLTYEQGEGPVIHNPIQTHADVAALNDSDPHETVRYTLDAIKLTKRELAGKLPLIGFSGAPFTLAAYAIEGGSAKDFRKVKQFMHAQPAAWHTLMEKLTTLVSDYLIAQIEAGADAVQIFDSWAGQLSPFDYAANVLPYVQEVIRTVRSNSLTPNLQSPPLIYFGTDMCGLSALLRQTGADVLGVDWRVNLDEAWAALGGEFVGAVQGNLDPATLFAPWPELERRTKDVLDRAGSRPGHIFNLGHGIMTETPVDNVKRLAAFVHEYSHAHIGFQALAG